MGLDTSHRSTGDTPRLTISASTGSTINDHHLRLALSGEIDLTTAGMLRDTVLDLVQRLRPRRVEIDLAEVDFMDSSGIAALLKCVRAARQRDCALVVVNPRPLVYRVFEVTSLLEYFGLPDHGPARRVSAL